jgi:hypothetical protein
VPDLDALFPIEAAERPLRFDTKTNDPVVLMRGELARLESERRSETDVLLAAFAKARFQLDRLAAGGREGPDLGGTVEALTMVAADLADLLEEHGVRALDLAGHPWDDQARTMVELRGHTVRKDIDAPRVVHMEQPAVFRGGRLIARGVALIETPPRE